MNDWAEEQRQQECARERTEDERRERERIEHQQTADRERRAHEEEERRERERIEHQQTADRERRAHGEEERRERERIELRNLVPDRVPYRWEGEEDALARIREEDAHQRAIEEAWVEERRRYEEAEEARREEAWAEARRRSEEKLGETINDATWEASRREQELAESRTAEERLRTAAEDDAKARQRYEDELSQPVTDGDWERRQWEEQRTAERQRSERAEFAALVETVQRQHSERDDLLERQEVTIDQHARVADRQRQVEDLHRTVSQEATSLADTAAELGKRVDESMVSQDDDLPALLQEAQDLQATLSTVTERELNVASQTRELAEQREGLVEETDVGLLDEHIAAVDEQLKAFANQQELARLSDDLALEHQRDTLPRFDQLAAEQQEELARQRGRLESCRSRVKSLSELRIPDAPEVARQTSESIDLLVDQLQRPTEVVSLIHDHESLGMLDEPGLGAALRDRLLSGEHQTVIGALQWLDESDRDDVAVEMVRNVSDDELTELASSEAGRGLLAELHEHLTTGFEAGDETVEARRVEQAVLGAGVPLWDDGVRVAETALPVVVEPDPRARDLIAKQIRRAYSRVDSRLVGAEEEYRDLIQRRGDEDRFPTTLDAWTTRIAETLKGTSPPDRSVLERPRSVVDEGRRALETGDIGRALRLLELAERSTQWASVRTRGYREGLIAGAERGERILTETRDTSLKVNAILGMFATGGAVPLAAAISGTSSIAAPAVQAAAGGQPIDWQRLSTDAAVALVTQRLGAAAQTGILTRLAQMAPFESVQRQMLAEALTGAMTGRGAAALDAAVREAVRAARGEPVTIDEVTAAATDQLLDVEGAFIDAIGAPLARRSSTSPRRKVSALQPAAVRRPLEKRVATLLHKNPQLDQKLVNPEDSRLALEAIYRRTSAIQGSTSGLGKEKFVPAHTRGHASELKVVLDYSRRPTVDGIAIVPPSPRGRTPDLVIFGNSGEVDRVEILTLTGGPRGRVKKGTAGLQRPTAATIEQRIMSKVFPHDRRPSQLEAPLDLRGKGTIPPGGILAVNSTAWDRDTLGEIERMMNGAGPKLFRAGFLRRIDFYGGARGGQPIASFVRGDDNFVAVEGG